MVDALVAFRTFCMSGALSLNILAFAFEDFLDLEGFHVLTFWSLMVPWNS